MRAMRDAMRAWGLGLGCGVLALVARAGAQEKSYIIPTDKLPPAEVVAVEDSTEETENSLSWLSQGHEQKGKGRSKEVKTITHTFAGPDKFTREMNSSSEEFITTVNGRDLTQPAQPKLLLKTPVVFERKDGQWTRSLADGAPLSDEQVKELGIRGKGDPQLSEEVTYGKDSHKIGEKWDVDVSKLPLMAGASKDGKVSGSMSCELVEVKEVQGLRAVVVKVALDLTEEEDEGSGSKKMHMKAEGVIVRCLDFALELESRNTGTMEMESHSPEGVVFKASGPISQHSSTTVKMP